MHHIGEAIEFYVLVEKRDDEKLRNVDTVDTLELEKWGLRDREGGDHPNAVMKGWSPADFPTPSNETTN